MVDNGSLSTLLIQLERMAAGLEAEGYFGAAKLCRALSRSLLTRAAYALGTPRAGGALESDAHALMQSLTHANIRPDVLAALRTGFDAARDNSMTTWEQIGAVHVCRICGEMFVADVPERCPECSSHVLTFWDVPHVFYLEPLSPAQVTSALATMPETLKDILADLAESQLAWSPAANEWSIRDVLWHLLMADAVLAERSKKLLAEDNPSLAAQAVWTFENDAAMTTSDLLSRFSQSRELTVARLQALQAEDWSRGGWHTEFGPVTLLQQASYFAKHERYHLPQITHLVRAAKTRGQ
jgi:uncharacterized damage-inducible protein DinB